MTHALLVLHHVNHDTLLNLRARGSDKHGVHASHLNSRGSEAFLTNNPFLYSVLHNRKRCHLHFGAYFHSSSVCFLLQEITKRLTWSYMSHHLHVVHVAMPHVHHTPLACRTCRRASCTSYPTYRKLFWLCETWERAVIEARWELQSLIRWFKTMNTSI